MPNFARKGRLDLDDMLGDYLKNNTKPVICRNIRTGAILTNAHHCEDKECNGAPSKKCIGQLHFTWCPAPVVDNDKDSPTFGEVVICGERFQCISPKGCATHKYIDGYNLDIKDARNDVDCVFTYRQVLDNAKAEHDEQRALAGQKQGALSKKADMTQQQINRQQKLQDQAAYKKKLEEDKKKAADELSARTQAILKGTWKGPIPTPIPTSQPTLKGPGVPLATSTRDIGLRGGFEGPVRERKDGNASTNCDLAQSTTGRRQLPIPNGSLLSTPEDGDVLSSFGRTPNGPVLNHTYAVSSTKQHFSPDPFDVGDLRSALPETQLQNVQQQQESTTATTADPEGFLIRGPKSGLPPLAPQNGREDIGVDISPGSTDQPTTRQSRLRRKLAHEEKKSRATDARRAKVLATIADEKTLAEAKAEAEDKKQLQSILDAKASSGKTHGRGKTGRHKRK